MKTRQKSQKRLRIGMISAVIYLVGLNDYQ
jgi:hypothetical protein